VTHAVEVEGLTKRYPGADRLALDDVSFATEEGEFLVLLGPSGCGKTTLLRTVAGLEHPTSGQVRIGGSVVNGLPPRVRGIAMVFQSYALYPHKSVAENIEFPLKAERLSASSRTEKVRWAAELLGIGHLLDRKPRHLSGGERQRVALARALVREPTVFLLDEPLSNLDAKLRASARTDLKDFQRRVGTTTIYVTHDQVEAMGMGDRIVVMYEGRIRQIGTPLEVYDEPADTYVATFLGSPPMNLIPNGSHIVAFRPESVLPAAAMGGGAEGHRPMTVKVQRIEHLSGDRHLHGTVTGLGEPSPVIIRLPATIMMPIDVDADYEFLIPESRLRFFDRQTGRRAAPVPLGR
jgi:multiple sugar transport system ATP-binding protein